MLNEGETPINLAVGLLKPLASSMLFFARCSFFVLQGYL